MKRIISLTLSLCVLAGCAPSQPSARHDEKWGNNIQIYSTTSTTIAQGRADKLCGSHAYFIDNEYTAYKDNPYQNWIPFNCDLETAAVYGSSEAKNIQEKKGAEAYKRYIHAVENLKESRRKNADPNKYESYTETGPDGTVRSYNFFGGKSCEAIVYSSGTAETHCE